MFTCERPRKIVATVLSWSPLADVSGSSEVGLCDLSTLFPADCNRKLQTDIHDSNLGDSGQTFDRAKRRNEWQQNRNVNLHLHLVTFVSSHVGMFRVCICLKNSFWWSLVQSNISFNRIRNHKRLQMYCELCMFKWFKTRHNDNNCRNFGKLCLHENTCLALALVLFLSPPPQKKKRPIALAELLGQLSELFTNWDLPLTCHNPCPPL